MYCTSQIPYFCPKSDGGQQCFLHLINSLASSTQNLVQHLLLYHCEFGNVCCCSGCIIRFLVQFQRELFPSLSSCQFSGTEKSRTYSEQCSGRITEPILCDYLIFQSICPILAAASSNNFDYILLQQL